MNALKGFIKPFEAPQRSVKIKFTFFLFVRDCDGKGESMFLVNPQTSKSMTSSKTLLLIRSYTFHWFFRILGIVNRKFVRY